MADNPVRCIVDGDGFYVDIVTMKHRDVLRDVPYAYEMKPGERLLELATPPRRLHAGTDGLIRPQLNAAQTGWKEGATAKEIKAWEAEHPAPEASSLPLTVEARLNEVDAALMELAGGLDEQETINQEQDSAIMEIGGIISG